MKLHRSNRRPEWQLTTNQWNIFQVVANRSHSIVTPGNVITIIGLCIMLFGLWSMLHERYITSVVLLVVGRLADVVDGWLADKTHTKSPFGELLDAGVDKIVTFLTIATLFLAHVTPWWILILLLLPHILIGIITIFKSHNHTRLHPSRSGKIGMAALWVGLIGLVLLKAGDRFYIAAPTYITAISSIVLSLWAAMQYVRQR